VCVCVYMCVCTRVCVHIYVDLTEVIRRHLHSQEKSQRPDFTLVLLYILKDSATEKPNRTKKFRSISELVDEKD